LPEVIVTDLGGKERARFGLHADPVSGVRFSGDGTVLASDSVDGKTRRTTVHVWEADTGKARMQVQVDIYDKIQPGSPLRPGMSLGLAAVHLSHDGGRLAVLDAHGAARVFETATGRELFAAPHVAGALVLGPDGRRLVTADEGHPMLDERAIHVWDVDAGTK